MEKGIISRMKGREIFWRKRKFGRGGGDWGSNEIEGYIFRSSFCKKRVFFSPYRSSLFGFTQPST